MESFCLLYQFDKLLLMNLPFLKFLDKGKGPFAGEIINQLCVNLFSGLAQQSNKSLPSVPHSNWDLRREAPAVQ